MIIETEHIQFDNGIAMDHWNWFLMQDKQPVEYGIGYDTEADALRAAYDWLMAQEA